MRRFAQSRASFATRRSCLPLSQRYSTEDGHVETTHGQAQPKTQSATSQTEEQDLQSSFKFQGTWAGVNPRTKTIKTAAGPLPISPLMDATWHKAKTRSARKLKKPPPFHSKGRFQKRVFQNPYVQMLASPVRICQMTRARLPKAFLDSYGLVTHPETSELWWVPAAFEQRSKKAAGENPDEEPEEPELEPEEEPEEEEPDEDDKQTATIRDETPSNIEVMPASEPVSSQEPGEEQEKDSAKPTSRFFAPAHVLGRQDLLMEFQTKDKRYSGGQFRFGGIPSIGNKAARAIWRKDMHDVLREHLRRGIVDQLVFASRAPGDEDEGRVNLVRLNTVKDALKHQNGACFLLLDGEHKPFDHFEVPGVTASAKAAYLLPELLGTEQFQRLQTEAGDFFRDGSLLLLKGRRNFKINMALWKLEAFLADYSSLKPTKTAEAGDKKVHT